MGKLGRDGGNKEMLVKLAQEIANREHGSYDSLLIAHKGKLLFESYYSRGRVNLPHYQLSATKAYTGLALGRAIQLGYLTMADLDKPLVSFLKDLDPTKLVEGAEKITLNHALTMRSGIRISKEQKAEFKKNPTLLKGQGKIQVLLEHSTPITAASQRFNYGGDPELVMQVIEAVVPGSAKNFIKRELLDKMGITTYRWQTNGVTGLPESGWRTSMTSRDMLKWGTLAMNKGQWSGEQLIPAAFISKATSRILYTVDEELHYGGKDVSNQGYGYFWWSADLKVGNKSYFSVSASGGKGQFITLIEELDLLVVHTAHDNDTGYLQITAERILSAFIENSIPIVSEKSDSHNTLPVLEGPNIGQNPPGLTPKSFAPHGLSIEYRDSSGFFTPDMKEFYFTRKNHKDKKWSLVVLKSINNQWHESVVGARVGRPIINPDGKTMFLGKNYMERTEMGWSEVKSLGPMFDRKEWGIMRLSASAKGTYVFDDYKGGDVIRISVLQNEKRQVPIKMGPMINTGKWTAHPFIAPDDSYLIWDSERNRGYGDSDLYISFRQRDGAWGTAINLGDTINTGASESGAYVTPDGKYLFFNRYINEENAGIYWVDAQVIEALRPK